LYRSTTANDTGTGQAWQTPPVRRGDDSGAVPEDHSRLVGWPQARSDGLGEQAPHRQDLLARVLHTGEHDNPQGAPLGEDFR
jgi:hypothetical protein